MRIILADLFENPTTKWGRASAIFLVILILVSTVFFVLETTEFGQKYITYFHYFDMFVVGVFTFEYLARLLVAPRKLKFMTAPQSILDLFVILAFYLSLSNFAILRGFRVLKVFQLLKIIRYSEVMTDFFRSFKNYRNELRIFWITLSLVLLLSSSGLYYLEGDKNSNFETIPDAIWWAVTTVSTVGYGDAVPITLGGKILGGFVMFLGIAVIAIFTAIITKMFMDHFFGKKEKKCQFCHFPRHDFDAHFCKNCGGELEWRD